MTTQVYVDDEPEGHDKHHEHQAVRVRFDTKLKRAHQGLDLLEHEMRVELVDDTKREN
jgi:hypothetical protein